MFLLTLFVLHLKFCLSIYISSIVSLVRRDEELICLFCFLAKKAFKLRLSSDSTLQWRLRVFLRSAVVTAQYSPF